MNKCKPIPAEKILFLKADINYTVFHLYDGKKVTSSTTLKRHAASAELSSFLRIHKSYLLNPVFIKKVEKGSKKASVLMQNGDKIMVSRRKVNLVEQYILNF